MEIPPSPHSLWDRIKRRFATTTRPLPPDPAWPRSSRFVALEDGLVRIASGFRFVEGPLWIPEEKRLLFSDIPANRIYSLEAGGRTSVSREPSHNSNGLTRDRAGRLIACEHGTRRVTRTEPGGGIQIMASHHAGKRLNSPNDVVVGPTGWIYFTDPPYGIRPEEQDQEIQGVYRIAPDGGNVELLIDDFDRPNGLAFSPDCTRLYIADSSRRRHIRAFDVHSDGTLGGPGPVLLDMSHAPPGVPDGLKVDVEGNLYCTGPGGIWIATPDGVLQGIVPIPEPSANCAWGDDDGHSLYITATTSVYRIRTRSAGLPPAVVFPSSIAS